MHIMQLLDFIEMNFLNNLIKKLFGKKDKKINYKSADYYSSGLVYPLQYSNFIKNIISTISKEIGKIDIRSIVERDGQVITQRDDITRLFLLAPNPYQSTSDFLENISWLRLLKGNAFIFPVYDLLKTGGKVFKAFYPLNPDSFAISNDGDKTTIILTINGLNYGLDYSEIIHLKNRRGLGLIASEDWNYDQELQSAIKSLSSVVDTLPDNLALSSKIKGLYSAKTLLGTEQLKNDLENFERHLYSTKSGILATDIAGEFQPLTLKSEAVEPNTLKLLKNIVNERFGISEEILSGNFTAAQNDAFYKSCIEEFIIQFEQKFTRFCFTDRELDFGHYIKCYYNKLNTLTESEKMARANFAISTGNMTLNEINTKIFGLPPFPEGDIRLQSLNYINSNVAELYQLEKVKNDKGEIIEDGTAGN